ncbi:hypothetical protein [Brasilonema sennae]|uniref:hypothetical protein n=1 Tax=Brasilonema sennae TaxID=1397703 RepID=UPI00155AC295|nr:hypothetical protein [Brasilonema sennae]
MSYVASGDRVAYFVNCLPFGFALWLTPRLTAIGCAQSARLTANASRLTPHSSTGGTRQPVARGEPQRQMPATGNPSSALAPQGAALRTEVAPEGNPPAALDSPDASVGKPSGFA